MGSYNKIKNLSNQNKEKCFQRLYQSQSAKNTGTQDQNDTSLSVSSSEIEKRSNDLMKYITKYIFEVCIGCKNNLIVNLIVNKVNVRIHDIVGTHKVQEPDLHGRITEVVKEGYKRSSGEWVRKPVVRHGAFFQKS